MMDTWQAAELLGLSGLLIATCKPSEVLNLSPSAVIPIHGIADRTWERKLHQSCNGLKLSP